MRMILPTLDRQASVRGTEGVEGAVGAVVDTRLIGTGMY